MLSSHFRFEEDFMAAHGYPKMAEHKAAHEKLLGQARKLNGGRAAQPDAIRRFWRGVESDLNDDADYLAYLNDIHAELTARLRSE